MNTTKLLAAILLALSFATAHAGEKFSALEGIKAEAMSADEMEAVQGKNFDFGVGLLEQYQMLLNNAGAAVQYSQQQVMANPEIQGWYYQALGGGYQGSFEMFVVNLGQTPQGLAAMTEATNRALAGVGRAIGEFNQGIIDGGTSRSNIATEIGNTIANVGTFVDPSTGASAVLPYTWQPGTLNSYNGMLFQVDFGGNVSYINQNGWAVPLVPVR